MKRGVQAGILAAVVMLSTGAASEMTVGEFLAGMKKAESMGPAALLSSDVRACGQSRTGYANCMWPTLPGRKRRAARCTAAHRPAIARR